MWKSMYKGNAFNYCVQNLNLKSHKKTVTIYIFYHYPFISRRKNFLKKKISKQKKNTL